MTPQKKVGYFTKLDPDLLAAMNRYKAAVGVPIAQQIDRALREWLAERPEAWELSNVEKPKGVVKSERKRVVKTRRRS